MDAYLVAYLVSQDYNLVDHTIPLTMEATSARMARDRFGGFAEPASSPLQRYIRTPDPHELEPQYGQAVWLIQMSLPENACDPQNFQPNIALNMEIVDMINAKKGSA